jgi:rare lipoprotein A
LLLTLSKLILSGFLVFIVSGCGSKTYNSSYYKSKEYKKSRAYKKIQNQEIKNSSAMHRATMRPYVVFGKKYYPTTTRVGNTYNGIASWYGPNFHAKKTSNGEIYDMFAFTAASKTLPMNTMVRVENLENGKSTTVRINDRGPFVEGRIIDLSNVAARQIDMVNQGTAKVRLTVIGFNGKLAITKKERSSEVATNNYFLQVGAFSKLDGAKVTRDKLNKEMNNQNYKAIIRQFNVNGKWLNRVWISGFRSLEEAQDYKNEHRLEHSIIIGD